MNTIIVCFMGMFLDIGILIVVPVGLNEQPSDLRQAIMPSLVIGGKLPFYS